MALQESSRPRLSDIASRFDGLFEDVVELAQAKYTYGRIYVGGSRSSRSRIDRWYGDADPAMLGRLVIPLAVEGSLVDRDRPSDHLTLRLELSRRCGKRAMLTANASGLACSAVFQAVFARAVRGQTLAKIASSGFRQALHSAREVASATARQLLRDDAVGARVLAQVALRLFIARADGQRHTKVEATPQRLPHSCWTSSTAHRWRARCVRKSQSSTEAVPQIG